LGYVAGGIALGTLSGLCPGVHVNNLALLLAAFVGELPGPARLVGAAMLAAGVVHSFLDAVPALALGVPDAAMAVSALPGHRLVADGRGREAVRLSALGSGAAVCCAIPLALPLTAAMTRLYPAVSAHLPVLLAAVATLLVATERTARARLGGALALAASGALGILLLDAPAEGLLPVGDTLAPLFAGLFGAPVLLEALRGSGIPPQEDADLRLPRPVAALAALVGAFAGAVVGYVPGVSAGVAATLALPALPGGRRAGDGADGSDRQYVVATSGVNTSNTIFALFALIALREPRTGVTVALNRAGVPLDFPLLGLAAVTGAAAGVGLVLALGDSYLRAVRTVDHRRLSLAVLALLLVLSAVFAGAVGVGAFLAAAAVGLLPARFGARRVSLMGVLLVPLAVSA
jgi:putative membrane protein